MSEASLKSLAEYSHFVSKILSRPDVERSPVIVWSNSLYTGTAEGEVWFKGNIKLRMREELDFDAGLITSYGYEVYRGDEKLYWYDDFPHPQDPSLASTFPHHKHIPPEIKRNRIPAPNISFTHPNLAGLIQEIEVLVAQA
ncbi:MAG: hypothetical protein HC866_15870 [Leptolyngbyaceae cyanobacterium RU_5_1]|nr:hypothetical protein [Leptolyngbyaceae cyanobacterium RU_5_1]